MSNKNVPEKTQNQVNNIIHVTIQLGGLTFSAENLCVEVDP